MRTILITENIKLDIAELSDVIRITAYNAVAILSGKNAESMRLNIKEADYDIDNDPSYCALRQDVEEFMIEAGHIEWDEWDGTFISIAEAESHINELALENEHRLSCADQRNYR
jgi:hypothetical protein